MGKIKQGILGGFKGKVGTVIGASWNGIAYMKGLPQSQKDPKTAAQMAQRNYFREIQGLAGQLTTEQLASLYPSVTSGSTRRNMLVHQLAAAAAIVDDVKTVDLSQMEGIGSGEHIESPMLESVVTLTNDVKDFYAEPAAAEQIGKPAEANFIVVAYNIPEENRHLQHRRNRPVYGCDRSCRQLGRSRRCRSLLLDLCRQGRECLSPWLRLVHHQDKSRKGRSQNQQGVTPYEQTTAAITKAS